MTNLDGPEREELVSWRDFGQGLVDIWPNIPRNRGEALAFLRLQASTAPPRLEPEGAFRVPSMRQKCGRCDRRPVADMCRVRHVRRSWARSGTYDTWYPYCADHLADYGREVRDGQVWFVPGLSLADRRCGSRPGLDA